jgi:AbrB family looped-hinge helix DNA binding protein
MIRREFLPIRELMETRRMSSRGAITIPKAILESRGWRPGQEFTVEETKDGILCRPRRPFKLKGTKRSLTK